ncbi:MAG: hypothetical protein E7666_03605 [Ruminococcaceae bacterium]|nr:hypothetical protein [Oscillospiraceae bacterium]
MARSWTPSQEAAMNLSGKALLVSAAAGSGKTSVLTERIIRRLLDPNSQTDLSSLLVVTFTRAAAAELKGRIANALTNALAQDPGNKKLAKQLLLLGSAQISTIDSFFQKIVRGNFERLGLPSSFQIAEESEIRSIAAELMDELIEEFYQKEMRTDPNASPLTRITENRFANALDHLLSNRSDGKLTDIMLTFFKRFAADPIGINRLKCYADQLRDASVGDWMKTPYGQALREYLTAFFTDYQNDFIRIQKSLEFDPDIAKKCSELLSSDLNYCRAVLDALDADDYKHLQAVINSFERGRFPSIRNKPTQVLEYQAKRTSFRNHLEKKVQALFIWPQELLSDQLLQTASLCDVLYVFYAEYEIRLMHEKRRRGILEYDDIRSILYRMLANEDGTASDFAKDLSAQYSEVYIDEYQDVDLLQDRIFALIGENRRFMVGDIKQSIYGFRGSDPSIFSNYRRIMPLYDTAEAHDADGICVFMSENFRCDRPIINFANRVCAFLFSACEKSVGYRPQDDLKCSKGIADGEREEHEMPLAQVVVFDAPPKKRGQADEDDDEDASHDEAIWIGQEIRRLLSEEQLNNRHAITPADIAILVQTKKQGRIFAEVLKDMGLPVGADMGTDFLHEPLTIDLLNLLRTIDNPYRDLPLSEYLLSSFCRFSLRELQEIRDAAPRVKALYDAMLAAAERSDALGIRIRTVVEKLESLRKLAVGLPADRFLRRLYLDESLAPYANDPSFLFLYEQARNYQKSSWCGLYGFLRHVDRMLNEKPISANGLCKAPESITIMTIHHSKGLEFPVVFLASCGSAFNHADSRENLLLHASLGCASKLYNPQSGTGETTMLRELLRLKIDTDQTEESIRTLYVALTRARERIYVTGTLRGNYDKAIEKATAVSRNNRYSILFCNDYLTWILAAMQENSSAEFPCTFQHISSSELKNAENESLKCVTDTGGDAPQKSGDYALASKYAELIREHSHFEYPLAFLEGLPTKAAASKLQENLLDILQNEDIEEEKSVEAQIALMEAAHPTFDNLLAETTKPSATDIGTATHMFLQFCDYSHVEKNGIDAEIARLVEKGFLTINAAEIIHRGQLALFAESDLFAMLKNAKKIYREQKFSINVPFSELTANRDKAECFDNHNLFVQGSIDLILEMQDGKRFLIDYKTDRISEAERNNPSLFRSHMKAAHGTQLSYYCRAVSQLFGTLPDKAFIYSLPLGGLIEIFDHNS